MQNVHTTLARTGRWKLQRWPTDPSVAHLVFTDMYATPGLGDFRTAIQQAAASGIATMRTSALFPASQAVAIEAGMVPIDRLTLLSRRLAPDEPAALEQPLTDLERWERDRVQTMRTWHLIAAAKTDDRAFGTLWAHTPRTLHEILSATQRSRARMIRRSGRADRGSVSGFLISGISDRTGYIQRLSVDPNVQRQGIGRALVRDSLGWMRRAGANIAFVNTGVSNTAALDLYRSAGFVDTGEVLSINEITGLRAGATDA